MTKPSKPGMLADPWRKAPAVAPAPPPRIMSSTANVPLPIENAGDTDNFGAKYTTIDVRGYGGITLEGTQDVPIAALQLLNFCVQEKPAIEDTLADYGIVISQLPLLQPTNTIKFYMQRADGWTLAIPLAASREAGALQLIQAFAKLYSVPALREKLQKYKIKPYKN